MRKSHRTPAQERPALASKPRKKLSGQTLFLLGSVVASAIVLAALAFFIYGGKLWAADSRLKDIPFNGTRAYDYLKQLCDLGPRPSGSAAMTKQQELLESHFKKLGAKVEFQRFEADYPADGPDLTKRGKKVPMANIIVRWNPENRERVALCSHYDTLPFPLMDKENKKGRFVGANDNASGVAILMELGNEYSKEPPKTGVDFVLFDGEEFLFNPKGKYFLGSEYFATDYAEHPPAFKYRAAVLMDMVGGAELNLEGDNLSMSWSDSAPLVNEIWATAAKLGVREFKPLPLMPREDGWITDDHLPLHEKGKIPSCDLIDISYMGKQWHTQADTPEHCSALSMAKVGWVLREWLRKQ